MSISVNRQSKVLAQPLVEELRRSPFLQAIEYLSLPASLISQARFAPECLDHNRSDRRGVITAGNCVIDGFERQAAFARIGFQALGRRSSVLSDTGSRESGFNQRDADAELPEFVIELLGVAFDCMFAGTVDRHVRRWEESHHRANVDDFPGLLASHHGKDQLREP